MSNHKLLCCGSNIYGQAGIGNGEDFFHEYQSKINEYIDTNHIRKIASSHQHTFILMKDGSAFSCGSNENEELARHGKRSIFQRIDAIETSHITDVCLGDGFILLVTKEGKIISWGKNDMGQLGNSCREYRKFPKLNTNISEGILQVSAGSSHVLALTKSGNVLSWGANRFGQLGDGQLTSSHTPILIPQLKHRPVISICCGDSHSLALTVGGNLYSWGQNNHGQLGHGDTTIRLRPELIRSLKSAKVIQVAAGKNHTMVISKSGLLFGFGSNSSGELGINNPEIRIQSTPIVIERFREMNVVSVTCGSGHTIVVCRSGDILQYRKIFGFGLNSSGQLGISTSNQSIVHYPQLISNDVGLLGNDIASIISGPLSMTTFVCSSEIELVSPSLPIVDTELMASFILRLVSTNTNSIDQVVLRQIREQVASSCSSISVCNASFRCDRVDGVDHNNLHINLQEVRRFYQLLLSTDNDQIINTLGRATFQLSEYLKECPFDDPENLSVFLVILENPLLLKSDVYYIAIDRVSTCYVPLVYFKF